VPTTGVDPWGLVSVDKGYSHTETETSLTLAIDFLLRFSVNTSDKTGKMPVVGNNPTLEYSGGNITDNVSMFETHLYSLQSITGDWGEISEKSRNFTIFEEPNENGAIGVVAVEFEYAVYVDVVGTDANLQPNSIRKLIETSTITIKAWEY
jgi:hypothetical protein